jgi:hypothetical protein
MRRRIRVLAPLVVVIGTFAGASIVATADTSSPQENLNGTTAAPPAAQGQQSPPAVVKPAPTPSAEKDAEPSVTIIGAKEAHAVLGRDVRSANGENMGRIVDIIVDKGGAVRAAVIDFGGFLGVGSRKIVVDWTALHFGDVNKKSDSITLELTREQVKAAPEYAEGKPIVVLGAAGKLQPLGFVP